MNKWHRIKLCYIAYKLLFSITSSKLISYCFESSYFTVHAAIAFLVTSIKMVLQDIEIHYFIS